MPTNPPANPLPGAVYVDQSTNIAWVWTGTYWLQATGGSQNYNAQVQPTTAILPGYYAEPSPDSWFPQVGATAPLNPGCGQIWIDNSVTPNYAQVWDCNTSTWIQLGGVGAGGDTNSIVSAVTPTTRVSGDPLVSGDLWINPANSRIQYFNGTTWVPISSTDTNTIYSAVQPTVRANADPLVAGDLWSDPVTKTLRFYDGLSWLPVVAVDPDHQLSATPPTLRPDGQALQVADLYTNTSSNTLFYWDGAAWNRYNDTHSFHDTVTPATRPDGSALQGGDQWFNPTSDELYVRDATTNTWVLVTKPDTHSIWSGVAPATRVDGTALQQGDMWTNSTFDLYNQRHFVKVYDGAQWQDFNELDLHSYVGFNAPTLTLRPDGRALRDGDQFIDQNTNISYYWRTTTSTWTVFGNDTHAFTGAGDPLVTNPVNVRPGTLTPLQNGDLYIDTVALAAYYYNLGSAAWIQFGSDKHSFFGAGTPYKSTSVSPGTNPQDTRSDGTALLAGDQYFDTNTNILYSYNGLAWVVVSGDTHSFIGAGTPYIAVPSVGTNPQTVRPDSSPLATGDMYIDTASKQGYFFDGADWVAFGTGEHSFTGAGIPSVVLPALRPDGTALREGDQYVDTSFAQGLEYTYIGGAWRPNGDVVVVTTLAALVGSYNDQLVVNSTSNRMYRWDVTAGPSWIQVS